MLIHKLSEQPLQFDKEALAGELVGGVADPGRPLTSTPLFCQFFETFPGSSLNGFFFPGPDHNEAFLLLDAELLLVGGAPPGIADPV